MKRPLVPSACLRAVNDTVLERILRRCGKYFRSGSLFYQELWRDRLRQIGFRVLLVEKLDVHDVWHIRVCGNLASQTHLLVSKKMPSKYALDNEALTKQFRCEIREIAKDLGAVIKRDCITVARTGAYFQAGFIWPLGRPGRLLRKEKPPEAFSFLIQPWVRRNRN